MDSQAGLRRGTVVLATLLVVLSLVTFGRANGTARAPAHPALDAAPASATAAGAAPTCSRANEFSRSHPGWVCTFDDEFDRTTHDAHHLIKKEWLPQLTADSGFRTGPPSEPACYISSHHNIWVSNGRLHLRVRKFPRVFSCATADGLSPWLIKDASAYPTHYTAGSVSTFDRFAQEYGRFAVRARVPKTRQPGLHEALWLWPSHPRRYGTGGASGEIDFAEFYSNFAKHVIPYVHYLLGPGNHNSDAYWNTVTARCPIRWGRFNTYVARWRPGIIRLTVNGATCLTNRYRAANVAPPAPFNQPFIIALTAGLGQTANALNRHATPFPATTTIAWVRVWKRG